MTFFWAYIPKSVHRDVRFQ